MIDLLIIRTRPELLEKDEGHIMTTWHEKETEKDVVWFTLNVAFPDESYLKNWKSIYFIEFSNEDKATKVEKYIKKERFRED